MDATLCNENSSRSHAILMLQLEATYQIDGKLKSISSKIHIVDLAGSERAKKSGSIGK